MEFDKEKKDTGRDASEGAATKTRFQQSVADRSLVINNDNTVAPVIIEELDESTITSMKVDMSEFVEAKALQIRKVENIIISNCTIPVMCNPNKTSLESEEQGMSFTVDEEDRLTEQFLNGELTFCEYSSKMDQDVDTEIMENDILRYNLLFRFFLFCFQWKYQDYIHNPIYIYL